MGDLMEANNAALDRGRAQEDKHGAKPRLGLVQYHADQRLMLIRFTSIMVGALGGGYLAALKDGLHGIVLLSLPVRVVVSVLFGRLDERVSDLVRLVKLQWRRKERLLRHRIGYDEIKIVERADIGADKRFASLSKNFSRDVCNGHYWFCGYAIVAVDGAW